MNVTIPGRLHVMVGRERFHLTLWLFGRRVHVGHRCTVDSVNGWVLP